MQWMTKEIGLIKTETNELINISKSQMLISKANLVYIQAKTDLFEILKLSK